MRSRPSLLKRLPSTDNFLKFVFQNISYKEHVLSYTSKLYLEAIICTSSLNGQVTYQKEISIHYAPKNKLQIFLYLI